MAFWGRGLDDSTSVSNRDTQRGNVSRDPSISMAEVAASLVVHEPYWLEGGFDAMKRVYFRRFGSLRGCIHRILLVTIAPDPLCNNNSPEHNIIHLMRPKSTMMKERSLTAFCTTKARHSPVLPRHTHRRLIGHETTKYLGLGSRSESDSVRGEK